MFWLGILLNPFLWLDIHAAPDSLYQWGMLHNLDLNHFYISQLRVCSSFLGLYISTTHTQTLAASKEIAQKPWLPNQQTSVLPPGYSTGHKAHFNTLTSNSQFSSDISYRNTNSPESQGQYSESLKQSITTRMAAVTGNIIGAPHDQTVRAFPGLNQNYERGPQQMTSSNLFIKNSVSFFVKVFYECML